MNLNLFRHLRCFFGWHFPIWQEGIWDYLGTCWNCGAKLHDSKRWWKLAQAGAYDLDDPTPLSEIRKKVHAR